MRTTDYMSERERQDIRDAGRGHLIDGSPRPFPNDDDYWRRVDEGRQRAKDESQTEHDPDKDHSDSELRGDQLKQGVAEPAAEPKE